MQADEPAPTFTEAARRAQIIRSAIETVNELGYHRASLAEIAKRAKVAKSAIVYYFASKDSLLLHVLDHVFTALGRRVAAAVKVESTPEARLRAYAENYLAHIDSHRSEMAAGVTIVLSHRAPDGVPLYLAPGEGDAALLRSIIGEGIDSGVFRPMQLPVAVKIAESLLDIAITTVQHDLDADLADLSQEIITVLFRGLLRQEP